MIAAIPTKKSQSALGCYLYAIVEQAGQEPLNVIGLDGSAVYTIGDGSVVAVVSDLPNGKIRPERRRLAAHHEVLKALKQRSAVLPMAFGVLADGPDAVRRILTLNREAFLSQIRRVRCKVEMGLRVVWDVPNIFEYFITLRSELRGLRDQVFWGGREPSQDDKIELGRMFDRILNEERSLNMERVTNVLRSYCSEIKENKLRDERDVMNLACLVDRDGQKRFEEGVFAAAGQFDNHFAFDFTGPWPPHNFVEIQLQM